MRPCNAWMTIGLALLLAGCNSMQPVDYQRRLDEARTCEQLSAFEVARFPADKPELQLALGDERSQALVLDNQKTFAVLVELPQGPEPYSINLRSLPFNNMVMPPRVRLLKADYSPSREFSANQFTAQRGQYQRTIFFNAENMDERFLLLYRDAATDKVLERTDILVSGSTIPVGAGFVYFTTASGDQKSLIKSCPGGTIALKMEKYAPQVAGKEH